MNVNRILKIAIVIVLTVAITLCIPGTFAKYSDAKNFTIVVDFAPSLYKDVATSTGSSNLKTVSVTAKSSGYYGIIIRGGNGESGLRKKGNFINNGSIGGYVYACVYANAGDVITAYIGNTATKPVTTTTYQGKNAGTAAQGGKGDTINVSTSASSGSGGAATYVTVNNTVVAIAAGGGGGGGSDQTIFNTLAKDGTKGGNGGNISSSSSKTNGYIIYYGTAGTKSGNRAGGAGTTTAGSRGTASVGNGNNGTVINLTTISGGDGGNGNSFGGGGGGGYAGGGGGAGNGNLDGAGGGGGGSSAIILTSGGKNTLKLKSSALSTVFSLAGYSADFSSYSGGFAIVAYLNDGSDTSQYSDGTF